MPTTVQGICQALEQAGAEFIPDGVRRRRTARPDARRLYDDLRTISLRSAVRLQVQVQEQQMEADLYDEDGLPT